MIEHIIDLFVGYSTRTRRALCRYHTIKGNRDGIYFAIDIKTNGPTKVSFKRFSSTGDLMDIDESEITDLEKEAIMHEVALTFDKAS